MVRRNVTSDAKKNYENDKAFLKIALEKLKISDKWNQIPFAAHLPLPADSSNQHCWRNQFLI